MTRREFSSHTSRPQVPVPTPWRGTFRRNRAYIALSCLLFTIGFAAGAVIGLLYSTDLSFYAGAAGSTHGPGRFTIRSVLTTNLEVLAVLASGAVSFGVATIPTLLLNGLVFGYAITTLEGVTILTRLLLFLPHAVLELPAYWVAGALGVKYPVAVGRFLLGSEDHLVTEHDLRDAAVLLAVAVALVAVGAVVEVAITPRIALLAQQ